PRVTCFGTGTAFRTAFALQRVFGGHGYIAEWGREQLLRDARVPMIYEGANGVQALDLAGRKLLRDGGLVAERFLALVEGECETAPSELHDVAAPLREAMHEAREAGLWLLSAGKESFDDLGAGSYAYMHLIGLLAVGWMWLRLARAALANAGEPLSAAKLVTARHYAARVLPEAVTLRRRVEAGASTLMALPAEAFAPQG